MEFDYEYHVTIFLTNFVEATRLVYRKVLYSGYFIFQLMQYS